MKHQVVGYFGHRIEKEEFEPESKDDRRMLDEFLAKVNKRRKRGERLVKLPPREVDPDSEK